MKSPNYCINCGVKLGECDKDSNGDDNCICVKCRAEEQHDFYKFPGAVFDRQGRRTDIVDAPDRYYVDERGGCIAVVDRLMKNPEENGLHEDMDGVVKYWQGHQHKNLCPTCHQVTSTEWRVADETREVAREWCANLNNQLKGKNSP